MFHVVIHDGLTYLVVAEEVWRAPLFNAHTAGSRVHHNMRCRLSHARWLGLGYA